MSLKVQTCTNDRVYQQLQQYLSGGNKSTEGSYAVESLEKLIGQVILEFSRTGNLTSFTNNLSKMVSEVDTLDGMTKEMSLLKVK